jgi:hypothetical protein
MRTVNTVRDVCKTGYCMPGKKCYFVDTDTERKIACRLILWDGPGWYSYNGSIYRPGRRASFSQISLELGTARAGGIVESAY